MKRLGVDVGGTFTDLIYLDDAGGVRVHKVQRCERYELRDEPAAPGKWRGGIGIVRENRFLVDGFFGCEGTRQLDEDPPRGVFGGRNGLVGSLTRNPGGLEEESINAIASGIPVRAGDLFQIVAPSGGGFGDPLERDPLQVREDVDGFTFAEQARRRTV